MYFLGVSLSDWLKKEFGQHGFSSRTFYGEAYAATLWSYLGESALSTKALAAMEEKKREYQEVKDHNEFILYAHYLINGAIQENIPLLRAIRQKPTNWILLRLLLRIITASGVRRNALIFIAVLVVRINRLKGGLLLDRRLGRMILKDRREAYRSDQYHAFMLVMLADLWNVTKKNFFKKVFFDGLFFVMESYKKNGEVIAVGRGKKQLFGYAALIYAFSVGYAYSSDERYLRMLDHILAFIEAHHRADGMPLPLVLVDGEEKQYWESYNNYYDYAPFAGALFLRSHRLICNK